MSCNRLAYEESTNTVQGLLRFAGGEDIEAAAFSSITYKSWRYSSRLAATQGASGTAVVTSGTLTVGDVILDPAETGEDGNEVNFRAIMPASDFPEPGWYRVEIKFMDAGTKVHHVVAVFEVMVLEGAT